MTTNWCDVLGFNETHLDEIRFTAWTYLKEGRLEDARRFFEGLVTIEPKNAYNVRTLGAIYLMLGDYPSAIAVFKRALELEPEHSGCKLNLAKAYIYSGQREDGLLIAQQVAGGSDHLAADAGAVVLAYGP